MKRINVNDIIGCRSGNLVIKEYIGSWKDFYVSKNYKVTSRVRHVYLAKCDCGGTKLVRRDAFLEGLNKSCGCKFPKLIKFMDDIIRYRIENRIERW